MASCFDVPHVISLTLAGINGHKTILQTWQRDFSWLLLLPHVSSPLLAMGFLKAESRSRRCVWTRAEKRAVIAALNKHDCNAEGKFSILSAYFHYRYLILHNKHMGTSVCVHPQMGSGKQWNREREIYARVCIHIYMYLYVSGVTIYIVTSEWFLCISCEAGGERTKVPKYVGQKKRSGSCRSANQTLTVLGMESPMPWGWMWSNIILNFFPVPRPRAYLSYILRPLSGFLANSSGRLVLGLSVA